MWPSRHKADVIGWLGVAGEGERAHCGWPPIDLLLSEREGVASEGDSAVELNWALAGVGRACRYGAYEGIVGCDPVEAVNERSNIRGLSGISRAVLEFFAGVEEESSVVRAGGETGDEA